MKVGDVVFKRVRITGIPSVSKETPMVPITELDADGKELCTSYAHPDALITPADIKLRLMAQGGGRG